MWRHPITTKQIRVLAEDWGVKNQDDVDGEGVATKESGQSEGWFQVIKVSFLGLSKRTGADGGDAQPISKCVSCSPKTLVTSCLGHLPRHVLESALLTFYLGRSRAVTLEVSLSSSLTIITSCSLCYTIQTAPWPRFPLLLR